jgi:inner membrane protein
MLPFGHAGITLGLTAITAVAQNKFSFRSPSKFESASHATSPVTGNPGKKSWLSAMSKYGDLRFLILGSLLPDIIDKPVGIWFLGSGKISCHSLLFLILLLIAGIFLWQKYRKNWLILVSAGTLTHLVLDQMWLIPHTLLWPLYGWSFPHGVRSEWVANILHVLLTRPSVYIPEIMGLAILLYFAWLLLHRKRVLAFLRHGQL